MVLFAFAWLIKHCGFLATYRHIQRQGVTAAKILFGFDEQFKLAEWGETVLFKVPEVRAQSKLLPRWLKGVWVGIREKDKANIVLDESGWHTPREVRRLPVENRWNKEMLVKAAGTPWGRHEGADHGSNKGVHRRA